MAIPAQITLVVTLDVDLGRVVLLCSISLHMTLQTGGAICWLRRSYRVWRDLVLLGCLMTCRARQAHVLRRCFCARDLSMAGHALLRHGWRHGRVRVMTFRARDHRVVPNRIDLGEAGWPRRIVGVTHRTELAWLGNLRIGLERLGVRGGRTMANLTRNAAVIAGETPLCDVIMACRADGVTREPGLASDNRVHGGCAVVSERAECRRNQSVARYNQPGACHQENAEEPGNLLIHRRCTVIEMDYVPPSLAYRSAGNAGARCVVLA